MGAEPAMKKPLAAALMLPLCMILLSACSPLMAWGISYEKDIGQIIGITLPDFEDKKYVDDRGWFADGTTTALYRFDDENAKLVKDQISRGEPWHALPLPEQDGIRYGHELAREAGIPDTENGYWYFSDDSPGAGTYDDAGILYGPPINFVLAIFDSDTNTLYYYEYDS